MIKTNYSIFFFNYHLLINTIIVHWVKKKSNLQPNQSRNLFLEKNKNTISEIYFILNLDFEDNNYYRNWQRISLQF